MKYARASQRLATGLMFRKKPVPESGCTFSMKKPHLYTKLDGCQDGRKLAGCASASASYSRKNVNNMGEHS